MYKSDKIPLIHTKIVISGNTRYVVSDDIFYDRLQ